MCFLLPQNYFVLGKWYIFNRVCTLIQKWTKKGGVGFGLVLRFFIIFVLILYNMRLLCGSLIHAGWVLIKVYSSICSSSSKDNFPMSLWAPLHTMLCQTGCVPLSIHVTVMHWNSTGGPSQPCGVLCTEAQPGNVAMEQVLYIQWHHDST